MSVLQESLGGRRDSFIDNGPLWKYVQGTVGEPDHFWGGRIHEHRSFSGDNQENDPEP